METHQVILAFTFSPFFSYLKKCLVMELILASKVQCAMEPAGALQGLWDRCAPRK